TPTPRGYMPTHGKNINTKIARRLNGAIQGRIRPGVAALAGAGIGGAAGAGPMRPVDGVEAILGIGAGGGAGGGAGPGICGNTGTVNLAEQSGHCIIWPAYCSGTWSCF